MQGLKRAKEIREEVARKYGYTIEQLEGGSREKGLSAVRFFAIFSIRKECDLSYTEIGWLFGHRDHSTVAYAVKWIRLHEHFFEKT